MIPVFSGTGNSLYVARLLAAADCLDDRVVRFPDCEEAAPGERVVWCFPVYSWGVPPVVIKWIQSVAPSLKKSGHHYAVMTCGDDTGNAPSQWRRLMKKLGFEAAMAYSVQMPNTYVLMKGFDTDPVALEKEKLEAAPARVKLIAGNIRDNIPGDLCVRGSWPWVKSAVIYPWFVRNAMSPRPFHPTPQCVGCGLCARTCPLGNITMKDKRPSWGDNCVLCLRCYHICPHHAVAYGKATKDKSQYNTMLKTMFKED